MSNRQATRPDSSSAGCVVVVGPSTDCCDVIETALCSRGLRAFSAPGARAGIMLIRDHDPAVVVLDGEGFGPDDGGLTAELQSQLAGRHTALIVLGRLGDKGLLPRQVVAKPYHFAPLIHTIEELAAKAA